MFDDVRRDVPGFVWIVGVVGLVALVVGYGLDLDSKVGDGLREMGWLGLGVLVTVAGVDIAQRRARAARWGRIVSTDARRVVAKLVGELWSDLLLDYQSLSLLMWTPSPSTLLAARLDEAFDAVSAARGWLWNVQAALKEPDFDPGAPSWRQLVSSSPLFADSSDASVHETTTRLLAVLDQLVEVTDDPELASEVAEVRTQIESVLTRRARLPASRAHLIALEPTDEHRATLDATAAFAFAVEVVIDGLRGIVRRRFPADEA